MFRSRSLTQLLSATVLCLAACATGPDDSTTATPDRDPAVSALETKAGAPVTVQVNEAGIARVVATTPRFPIPGHATDPVEVAKAFLAEHHDVFQLSAADAASFVVTRVDVEAKTGLRHITLQRAFNGIPVFQGGVTVHMDSGNNVVRVVGDEFYRIDPPTNRQMLSPADAAVAAGKALGLSIAPTLASSEGLRSTFTAPGTLDPTSIELRIFQVAPDDNRFAYQAQVSWRDDQKQQQYQLVLIDAQDGTLLYNTSLVNTFTGRAATVGFGARPVTDTRQLVSFDGTPAASPQGWVGAGRTTVGNNAVACTDLNANNNCAGGNETQPLADANDSFDLPFNPLQDSALFKPAAVASAFYLVNDYHDRTYGYGFTEAAGNFQTNNFGLGGLGNDEVQVDAQDGSGTNNANFATPIDGSKPRMQMFLFSIVSGTGLRQDGDFDPGVIYHENSHGLSNRLVGGGSGACLNGSQSGGMGEGWGDFIGASFLNDPVVGAYVTGNAAVGIRRASMAASPFTYGNIKDGTMTEVHDAGEIWAATLWDIRNGVGGVGGLGAATTERLVVQGMKLTPCRPTMLQARDAIIAADVNLNGGANGCALAKAFANRKMGTGASSPNDTSTSAIVLSTAVPIECSIPGGVTRTFTSTDVPKAIPDNNATGISSVLNIADVPGGLDVQLVQANVTIKHTFRGDLVVQLIAPNGQTATLSNRAGGSADDFVASNLNTTASFTPGSSAAGQWRLFVRDLAALDVGNITAFSLKITSSH
jgi:subtilisin-like proprotein convertase family protein